MTFRAIVLCGVIAAACGTSPFEAPPIVLRSHVSGSVVNANGTPQNSVDVLMRCPVADSVAHYPLSPRLSYSQLSNSSGVYHSWNGIDAETLQKSGKPLAPITMTCGVSATRNGLNLTVSPNKAVVHFVPAEQEPPVDSLNLQVTT